MSMAGAIRELVLAKLEREERIIEQLPRMYQMHLKVWYDDEGAPMAVTIDYAEALPQKKWRRQKGVPVGGQMVVQVTADPERA